jgi:hypothetical protein
VFVPKSLTLETRAAVAIFLASGHAANGAKRPGNAPIAARFGLGIGLSYALGTPSYEDGPSDDPARRYKLQNFNNYELAFSHSSPLGDVRRNRSAASGIEFF